MADTLIRVVDTETVGLEKPAAFAGVCEIGWTDIILSDGPPQISEPESALCHPGCSIPPEASGIHHITDAMVKNAPPAEEVMARVMDADAIFAAHFAEYDQQFLPPNDKRWICTYKAAHRCYPLAPDHKNQTLRYWLGHVLDPELCTPAHRAGPDTYVSAHNLVSMIADGTAIDDMIAWASLPVLLVKCQIGEHRGKFWEEVPEGFIDWLLKKQDSGGGNFDVDTVYTARYYSRANGET